MHPSDRIRLEIAARWLTVADELIETADSPEAEGQPARWQLLEEAARHREGAEEIAAEVAAQEGAEVVFAALCAEGGRLSPAASRRMPAPAASRRVLASVDGGWVR